MRIVNRLLAALLALAVAAAGVLLLIEVTAARLGKQPVAVAWHGAYDWARRTPWSQGSVRVACIVVALAGLLLLAAELRRGRPDRLPTNSEVLDAAYTRGGVASAVRDAVQRVDGISGAAVSVGSRKVAVTAAWTGQQPHTAEQLKPAVEDAARRKLADLALRPDPSLSVRVVTRSR